MTERLDWPRLGKLLREPHLQRLAELSSAGHELALVGGAIRDALLGRDPQDADLVALRDLGAVIDAVERQRGMRPTRISDDFQDTHRFRWHGRAVDIAAAIGTLEDDLARRDFTINAMALRLPVAGEPRQALVDPHGGLRDLRQRQLRPVCAATIAADPLRVMRGVRYVGDLTGFTLSDETRSTLSANAAALAGVAAERVSNEWQAILASAGWSQALEVAWDIGVGAVTLGARRTDAGARAWAAHEVRSGVTEDLLAGRLAAMLFDLATDGDPDSLATMLVARRWPRELARTASRAARWAGRRGVDEAKLARLALYDSRAALIAGQLARAVGAGGASRLALLAQRAREPRWVTGADLRAHGMEPGPEIGDVLAEAAQGQVLRRWANADKARAWAAARSRELS